MKKIKAYNFSKGLKRSAGFDEFITFIVMIFSPAFLCAGVYYIFNLDSFISHNVYRILLYISFIIGVFWRLKYKASFKGVVLCDDYLQIYRHYPVKSLFVFNPKIYYDDIKSCEIRRIDKHDKKGMNEIAFSSMRNLAENYVRIQTRMEEKIYLFSVEDYEECYKEIQENMMKHINDIYRGN